MIVAFIGIAIVVIIWAIGNIRSTKGDRDEWQEWHDRYHRDLNKRSPTFKR